jgi:hypothetical protein
VPSDDDDDDPKSMANKRAVLENDRRVAYSDVVDLFDDTKLHGRFALGTSAVGNQVPRQPPHSPWFETRFNGPEPPLGYSVDQMEPVGTPAEVARSVEAATQPSAPTSPCSVQRPSVGGAASLIRRRC